MGGKPMEPDGYAQAMSGSRVLAIVLGGIAIVAVAVVIVSLGSEEGDDPADAEKGAAEVAGAPDYEGFLEKLEQDPELIASVTVTGEDSVTVIETTGSSYELEVEPGEVDSLVKTLESSGVEVEQPKN
jgi:hypothetical protein